MQILLHLNYISRGIFDTFVHFLGKNSTFRLFYILSQASEHSIYLLLLLLFYFYLFFFFFGGGGGGGGGGVGS